MTHAADHHDTLAAADRAAHRANGHAVTACARQSNLRLTPAVRAYRAAAELYREAARHYRHAGAPSWQSDMLEHAAACSRFADRLSAIRHA